MFRESNVRDISAGSCSHDCSSIVQRPQCERVRSRATYRRRQSLSSAVDSVTTKGVASFRNTGNIPNQLASDAISRSRLEPPSPSVPSAISSWILFASTKALGSKCVEASFVAPRGSFDPFQTSDVSGIDHAPTGLGPTRSERASGQYPPSVTWDDLAY